jgi:hypothetical protein
MSAREYVEAIARELSRLRGRGVVLSPADSALALAWHSQGVTLPRVITVLREQAPRLLPRRRAEKGPGASAAPTLSLQIFAAALSMRQPAQPPPRGSLSAELLQATAAADLPARTQWERLAAQADELLAGAPSSQRTYWSLAHQALRASLRELPRASALQAGAALRERCAPRPPSMARHHYRRSLQLMLLSASSARLGVPPAAFLL